MGENVVVTGGAGFIGSHIAAYHLKKGDHVWVVDNMQAGRLENMASFRDNPHFQFDQSDVRTWPRLHEATKWADRIYHMAANVGQRLVLGNPVDTLWNNIQGCEKILEAMTDSHSQARLLIASSSGVYCHNTVGPDGLVHEDDELIIPSGKFLQEVYHLSKLINEVMGLTYCSQKKIHCTVVRIFNTVGVNQSSAYGMVLPTFVEEALSNKPLTVYGDGLQTRSFSNVLDTVRALDLLLDNPKSDGEIVNVGDDRECSIIHLAEMVKELAHSDSEICYLTYKEAYGIDFHDVRRRRPDLRKLKSLTGFQPQYSIKETIEQSIAATKERMLKTAGKK